MCECMYVCMYVYAVLATTAAAAADDDDRRNDYNANSFTDVRVRRSVKRQRNNTLDILISSNDKQEPILNHRQRHNGRSREANDVVDWTRN